MYAHAADPYGYGRDYYTVTQASGEPMVQPTSRQPTTPPTLNSKKGPKLIYICSLSLMCVFLTIAAYSFMHIYEMNVEVTDTSRSESSRPKRRMTESTSEVVHTARRNTFGRGEEEKTAVQGHDHLQRDGPGRMRVVRPRIGHDKIPPPLNVSEGWRVRSRTTHAPWRATRARRKARKPRRRPYIPRAISPRTTSGYTWSAGIVVNSSSKRSSATGTFVIRGHLLTSESLTGSSTGRSTERNASTAHNNSSATAYIDSKWHPIMPFPEEERISTETESPPEQTEGGVRVLWDYKGGPY